MSLWDMDARKPARSAPRQSADGFRRSSDEQREQAPQGKSSGTSGLCQAEINLLDGIQSLLDKMMELAKRAASDACTDKERAMMQRQLIRLRLEVDRRVDNYERRYGKFSENLQRYKDQALALTIDRKR